MTVYVDGMRLQARVGRINARWSHMWADTEAELVEFALKLGLKPSWIQRKLVTHFDLTDKKRDLAIQLGAVPLNRKASVENWMLHRNLKRE